MQILCSFMCCGTKYQKPSNSSISHQAAIISWLRNVTYFTRCCWFLWNICSCCQIIHTIRLMDHWTFFTMQFLYWSPQMALFPQTMICSQSVCQNRIPEYWALQEANALQQFVLVLSKHWVQKPSAKTRMLSAIIHIHDANKVFLKSPSELQRSNTAWQVSPSLTRYRA